MSREPEEYVVEFEDRPGRWVPIAGEASMELRLTKPCVHIMRSPV